MVVTFKSKSQQRLVPSILHPTLFLAQMLAREGQFPPEYLDGFQRLIDDTIAEMPEGHLSSEQEKEIKATVLETIRQARINAGLE